MFSILILHCNSDNYPSYIEKKNNSYCKNSLHKQIQCSNTTTNDDLSISFRYNKEVHAKLLSNKHRETIIQLHKNGKSNSEIADHMELKVIDVSSVLHVYV